MLKELSINNVAAIKEANIDFEEGLNIFTGETGAGKSILIGSISMVLGLRTSKELIRTGEKSASVSALFINVASNISKKIKATLTSQKKLGKFMGGTEPYGYKKNIPYDKHQLIIDEETAPIVKRIFNMAKSGMGLTSICNTLTDENIPSPSVYKGKVYKNIFVLFISDNFFLLLTIF